MEEECWSKKLLPPRDGKVGFSAALLRFRSDWMICFPQQKAVEGRCRTMRQSKEEPPSPTLLVLNPLAKLLSSYYRVMEVLGPSALSFQPSPTTQVLWLHPVVMVMTCDRYWAKHFHCHPHKQTVRQGGSTYPAEAHRVTEGQDWKVDEGFGTKV